MYGAAYLYFEFRKVVVTLFDDEKESVVEEVENGDTQEDKEPEEGDEPEEKAEAEEGIVG